MIHAFHFVFALSFISLPLCATAQVFDSSTITSAGDQTNNIPSQEVLALMAQRFENARMPLATGDLRLDSRWNCRELFTEAGGYSSYRFKSISLRSYENQILEDVLNNSPRLYVFTKTALIGASTQRGGASSEIRVDREGNLRIASRSNTGKFKSFTVCLKKNWTAH